MRQYKLNQKVKGINDLYYSIEKNDIFGTYRIHEYIKENNKFIWNNSFDNNWYLDEAKVQFKRVLNGFEADVYCDIL